MKKIIFVTIHLGIIFSAYAQLNQKDTIKTIDMYFQTSNDILSGTDNDVWVDIGPKAWRISTGFEKGTLKQFTIDNPTKLTKGSLYIVKRKWTFC